MQATLSAGREVCVGKLTIEGRHSYGWCAVIWSALSAPDCHDSQEQRERAEEASGLSTTGGGEQSCHLIRDTESCSSLDNNLVHVYLMLTV